MEIKIKDKTYEIEEITVKNSQKILEKAIKLVAKVAGNPAITKFINKINNKMSTVDFLTQGAAILPLLLNIAFNDTIELISLLANIPKEELENFGVSKLITIIKAIAEVNDIPGIIDNLKNSVGALKAQAVTAPAER